MTVDKISRKVEWFNSLSIDAKIEYANKWNNQLTYDTVQNSMYKSMTFSMICNNHSAIKAIYDYMHKKQ